MIYEILADVILEQLVLMDGQPLEHNALHILVQGQRDKHYGFVAARSEVDGAITWLMDNGRIEWRPEFPDRVFYTLTALERLARL